MEQIKIGDVPADTIEIELADESGETENVPIMVDLTEDENTDDE